MSIRESGEMYLETILILSQNSVHVRSIDVVNYMGFSKPSVSRGVKILKESGYLIVHEDGALQLTETGRALAQKIYERHTILTRALELLGVASDNASDDACKIEHDISDELFEAIKKYVELMRDKK